MTNTLLAKNYTSEEREEINVKYSRYINELHNEELRNRYIESRIKYDSSFIKFQNICFKIISFSIVILILSIIGLTLFKKCDWYIIFAVALFPPIIIIPVIIYYWIVELLNKIFCNTITHQNEEKNNISKLYEKTIFEKYEKDIKAYEEMSDYDKLTKKIKLERKDIIMKKLFALDDNLFKEVLTKIITDNYKVKECDIKNCFECINSNKRLLLMYKKMKRSISISDVNRFEEYILKDSYDYGILCYIGDISTEAVNYCSHKQGKKIYLFSHYDICDRIYAYETATSKKIL